LFERQESGPVALRKVNQDVDRPLAGVVEKCLAFDPEARPQSAEELAKDLRRSGAPVHRVRRWAKRHTLIAFCSVACLLVISFLTGYYFWTRAPYAVRMFNRAGAFFQEGDYSKAHEFLSRAVGSAKPDRLRADCLLWRGQALLKLGKHLEATKDFEQAAEILPTGQVFACWAYAYALEGLSARCINLSGDSIDAGSASAEVYNNLGWGFYIEKQYAQAVAALDKAIALEPGLRPAFYTRALAEVEAARREKRSVSRAAIADIEKAVAYGPANAYISYDAALIYSQLDVDPAEYREKVVQHLCRAARGGVDPKIIRRQFPSVVKEPRLRDALGQNPAVVLRSRLDQIADPLPVEAFPFR
jgi:tetratricopeptide (TPR) repeat protein